jgi:hypothetical protein
MPLRLTQAANTPALWEAMSTRFLDELGDRVGPEAYPAHLWLRDRRQRDMLLEAAQRRGYRGWLGTPFSFWTDLPALFDVRVRPIGLLTQPDRSRGWGSMWARRPPPWAGRRARTHARSRVQ